MEKFIFPVRKIAGRIVRTGSYSWIRRSMEVDRALAAKQPPARLRKVFRAGLTGSLIAASLALTGCLSPQPYRVSQTQGGLRVDTPNSYVNSTGRQSLLYYPGAIKRRCAKRSAGETFIVRLVPTWREGREVSAIQFESNPRAFTSVRNLNAALDAWFEDPRSAKFIECYKLSQNSVRRSLLAQRPQLASEILDFQFAFDAGADTQRLRTILLRPGVRVCASDVAPIDRNLSWRALGSTCARLVGAPNGGILFDATAGRYTGLASPVHNGAQDNGTPYRIASFSEIQRTNGHPHAWVLVYPETLLEKYSDSTDPTIVEIPLLVGFELGKEESTSALLETFLQTSTDLATDRLNDICKDATVICYTFGERVLFTVDFVVLVNGSPMDVGIGATVGDIAAVVAPDLFARDLLSPAAQASEIDQAARARAELNLSRLKMSRVFDGRLAPIDFSQAGASAYSLPLQPGDRLTW